MPRDFSRLNPDELLSGMTIHRFPALLHPETMGVLYPVWVKVLDNYIAVGGHSTVDFGFICSKDGALQQKMIMAKNTGGSFPGNQGFIVESQDVLIGSGTNANIFYGLNFREDGLARNINNTAALPGFIPPYSPHTVAGYGWVLLNTAGNLGPYYEFYNYPASSNYVGVATENTTYPSKSPPAAPSCTPSNTGGYLEAGAYDVRIAWVTKLNTRRSNQGITLPSDETADVTVAAGSTGSIAVTIPDAADTEIKGYVVYCVEADGTPLVVGGGIAPQGTTKVHTIKETMAGLNMANRIVTVGSASMQVTTIGTIENANPLTYGTSRTTTSGYLNQVWSPFSKDPSQIYMIQAGNVTTGLVADKYDIMAGTIALAQTVTVDGEPFNLRHTSVNAPAIAYKIIPVPSLMAYAVAGFQVTSSGSVSYPGFLILKSMMTNQILWSCPSEFIASYSTSAPTYPISFFDFEEVDGAVDCLIGSRAHGGVLRVPVGWYR